MTNQGRDWFEQHKSRLEQAVHAVRQRHAWGPFVESPSRRHHPPQAHASGKEAFQQRLNRSFVLDLPGEVGRVGAEVSPYTGQPLGIDYPRVAVAPLMAAMERAQPEWADADPDVRVGICMEMLARFADNAFENAYATMHTAGQGFMLAFAGSGASALDRGLEALATAWLAMDTFPREAQYSRRFGTGGPVHLKKRYRMRPVGIAVVLSCGSYPAWNAYPAIVANLATGNPVVLKPHPDTILPMAIAVEQARAVLVEAGFDPNVLTMACDSWEAPIARALFDHPKTAIIDFTGGQRFGAEIERDYAHLQVYTETAGCNAVVLEAATDLDAVLTAIAHGLVLFSAQMCTAPQNIWVPADGVWDGQRRVSVEEVMDRLVACVDRWVSDPVQAAGLCGALHSPRTVAELEAVSQRLGDRVIRPWTTIAHPEFPQARTATPLLGRLDASERSLAQQEHFGPMAFVIVAPNRDAALAGATEDARRFGAIASYAYTTDEQWLDTLEDAFFHAGASVGINLIRQRPINFTAAYSDFHVTGLNPAGTASLSDLAFVSRRFRIVQSKRELPGDE